MVTPLHPFMRRCGSTLLLLACANAYAQFEGPPLGNGPWVIDTYQEKGITVSILARGLDHPFGIEFLPGTATAANPLGDALISERTGKVRLYREGRLQEAAVADFAATFPFDQLFDIELHPRFADNGLVYFTYIRKAPRPDGSDGYYVTTALARGRWNGTTLEGLEDVFVAAKAWSPNFGGASSRLHFLADGTLLFGVSHRLDEEAPQRLDSHIGKILRLNDDGTVPTDNPFFAVEGALPEIWSLGIRSVMDFTTHPVTGEIWELENGPQGGDEVNILKPAVNYGWPVATFGRDYDGSRFSPQPWVDGTELPVVAWIPSITVAGMTFYTGAKFPQWQGNLFVTSMITGRVPGTGHLERVVFNEQGEIMREELLNDLQQRIRYVTQGPDELLYLLTDHSDGALLRMAPAGSADAVAGTLAPARSAVELVFADQDCATCHRTEDRLVGPSYQEIASRYKLTGDNIALLADRIIQGGSGPWGEVPMTPHPALGQAAARAMAERILGLGSE